MKPFLSRLATCGAGLLLVLLGACGASDESASGRSSTGAPRYVTTINPFEAILTPVVGQRGTVEKLLPTGASPHTYDPRPSDLNRVTGSRGIFYGAAHLDEWAAELAAPATALLNLVPDSLLLIMPSNAQDEAHAGSSIDPHFWSDPQAVKAMLPALADTLCALDASGCVTYRENADAFAQQLDSLDAQVRSLLAPVEGTPVLLSQPFFRYFLKRYGFPLVDVIEPAPGKEPSPRALQATIRRAEREQARAIFTLPQLPARSARAVAEATGLPLVQLDPLGGEAGNSTYAELLLHNARLIRDALS